VQHLVVASENMKQLGMLVFRLLVVVLKIEAHKNAKKPAAGLTLRRQNVNGTG
jgi:hypothetical protein